MVRRKYRRHSRKSRKIPLAPVIGLAGTILGGKNETTLSLIQGGNLEGALYRTCINLTGFDPATGSWNWQLMNLEPAIVGLLVHMTLGKLINKRIHLPYISI